ncbi:hypothetical protein [Rhodopirellula europaea]|uniref:hypothetical protein n=1 Tax=Rhodopirellula europaea TaxID=1263866 RepID=UPI003D2E459D|tara:strand:+ start:5952 stop:6350 length:399 start_codon:yes stop_codon:yes gene_type:complete
MDRAATAPAAEEIASLVVERLISNGGLEDFANANLMTIEDWTIQQVDRVTRLVMDEIFAKQAQQAPAVTFTNRETMPTDRGNSNAAIAMLVLPNTLPWGLVAKQKGAGRGHKSCPELIDEALGLLFKKHGIE